MGNQTILQSTRSQCFALFLILTITFISYLTSLDNQFVNWDDTTFIIDNPAVKSLNIAQIFSYVGRRTLNTYVPLTTLSFSLEHHFFQNNPFFYHLDNVLLHLGVVALIFLLALKMGLNLPAAFMGSLLFGIHPIHVESVAWVTERKDVLYSLFYLLALYHYWNYLEKINKYSYLLTIVFATLSMLAKPMAYSLPLIFLLSDWFYGRKLNFRVFIEKIPHVLIIFGISFITYSSNPATLNYQFDEVLLIWIFNFCFYIQKFIFPSMLSPIYELPEPVSILQPSYALAILTFIILIFIIYRFRFNRRLIAAVLFYALSIFIIVLRSAWVFGNRTIMADRFMYLPSLGFCLLFGYGMDSILNKLSKINNFCLKASYALPMIIFIILAAQTIIQNNIWENSLVLWSSVIEKNPNIARAYVNRSEFHLSKNNYNLALADLNEALRIDPLNDEAYFYRANVYSIQENYEKTIANYKKAIELNPDQFNAYFNLGFFYDTHGQSEQALIHYSKAIEIYPEYVEAYNNRGFIYLSQEQYQLALEDFAKALKINPYHAEAYNNIGSVFFHQEQYPKAFFYFNKAISINPEYADAYSNRAVLYSMSKRYDLALTDINRAIALDPSNRGFYANREQLRKEMRTQGER